MKKYFYSLCLLIVFSKGFSQSYLGVINSNYAGVMGNDLNPASFVDGRFKSDIVLFNLNISAFQNLGYLNTKAIRSAQGGKGYWWTKSFLDSSIFNSWAKPDSTFIDRFIVHNYDQNSNDLLGVNTNIQVDLLNFMFHISPKIAVGFTAKVRSITNLDNLDPKLAVLAEKGLEYPNLWNQKFNEELFNMNHMTWGEYGLNYSQVILDKSKHFLKAGAKMKYLVGYSSAYFYTRNFAYNLRNEDTSQYLSGDVSFGFSSNFDNIENSFKDILSGNFSSLLNFQSKFGLGMDLGLVYEWRPDWQKNSFEKNGKKVWAKDKNKYKARFGVSVLDIGGVKYFKGGVTRDFSINSTSNFDLRRFYSSTSLTSFDLILDSLIDESALSGNNVWISNEKPSETFLMRTPTSLSIQADYHIWKWFYVNATGMLNLTSRKMPTKIRIPNQLSITPSFDFSWLGVHIPISINSYSGFKVGAATRMGPLTFGFTDVKTMFALGKIRGAEFFIGMRLPVLYETAKAVNEANANNKMDGKLNNHDAWSFLGASLKNQELSFK
jgi:hypothetical protein